MIVVADASPLNYLIQLEEIHLLPSLFTQILVPQAVFKELQHPRSPVEVQRWISAAPPWLQVKSASANPTPKMMTLDPGEREAILLALELDLNMVLIDESAGRALAKIFHLEVQGTLGILERGAKLGMIDFRAALAKLDQTNFRMSPAVRAAFLHRNP